MKKWWIIGLIVILLVGLGIYLYINSSKSNNLIVVKLTNINPATSSRGDNFVESAGYYEGQLNFTDIKNNKEYPIFACSKEWAWVKEGNCYKFNIEDVNNNIESHKYSSELSGCYVGTLEQTSC